MGRIRAASWAAVAMLACIPAASSAAPAGDEASAAAILDRLELLERRQAELEARLEARDARIAELEAELGGRAGAATMALAPSTSTTASLSPSSTTAPSAATLGDTPVVLAPSVEALEEGYAEEPGYFGEFQPAGAGFKLADTPYGDVNFSAWAYARYLNQKGLESTYTDAFGRTRELDLRNDVQLNKVNLYFKGWLFDPKFRYFTFIWTANASMGEPAQVVVGGNIGYHFNDLLELTAGIGALPGTRSLRGQHPYWLKTDHRTISDEFFRPSYTTGVFATGALAENVRYKVMLGNNLAQLGVSAPQLDGDFNTVSAALWWTPTGQYNPRYGDFEYHEVPSTQFGIAYTQSREDRQSQPGTEDIENTQIRLSDGTVIFQPDAFASGGRINRATYRMASADAGIKYRGLSLEGAYYVRWVDEFDVTGTIPVDELFDHGVELQTSAMLMPQTLQAYVAASKIFGEYGDPWDLGIGMNWFPFKVRPLRVNAEALYLKDSPVGYASVPFAVGGNGWIFQTNLEIRF